MICYIHVIYTLILKTILFVFFNGYFPNTIFFSTVQHDDPVTLYREPPYDPAIPLVGIYPDKTFLKKDTCTHRLTAALFTIAKTWKQSKRPSIGTVLLRRMSAYTFRKNGIRSPYVPTTWPQQQATRYLSSLIWSLLHPPLSRYFEVTPRQCIMPSYTRTINACKWFCHMGGF